jgi:hypothetical protein
MWRTRRTSGEPGVHSASDPVIRWPPRFGGNGRGADQADGNGLGLGYGGILGNGRGGSFEADGGCGRGDGSFLQEFYHVQD